MEIGVIATMKRGLELFVYRELRCLAARGDGVHLFPTRRGRGLYGPDPGWRLHAWGPLAVILAQPQRLLGAPALYLRLLGEALALGALADFALAWYFAPAMAGLDLIYATFGDHKLFVGYFASRIVRRPLAVTIHAYELYRNPNPRLFARALRACARVITVTEYNRELLAARYGLDPNDVEMVRLGVNLDEFSPKRRFAVLIVGSFVERKGHEVLFRALQALDQDDIEVWVVGGPGAEEPVDVRGMAEALGVAERVAFFGAQSGAALRALYRSCDVFCLPCHTDSTGVAEGFPTVLIEALASGKPVITTRHVEIPRVIGEILVDENDAAGLAAALRRLYASRELRERLGREGRALAERSFSAANLERKAALLEALAGCPGPAPGAEAGAQAAPGARGRGGLS